jgi:hypothetical protein
MMAEVLSVDDAKERYRRFLQGDKEALAGLVRDYHKGLTLYLNGILGNICDAEDMAQETGTGRFGLRYMSINLALATIIMMLPMMFTFM